MNIKFVHHHYLNTTIQAVILSQPAPAKKINCYKIKYILEVSGAMIASSKSSTILISSFSETLLGLGILLSIYSINHYSL
jgi:hypothetical protein